MTMGSSHLDRIIKIKDILTESEDDVDITLKELENFVFEQNKYGNCRLKNYVPTELIEFFQDFYYNHVTQVEKSKAIEFINHTCDQDDCLLENRVLSRTFDYAKDEGMKAGMTKDDKVLMIGSGPFPATAIAYARLFGCNVTCVEKEAEFADISRQVIQKMGISDKITVLTGLGENIKADEFTKILITVMSKPKSAIIENVRESNATIILRTTFGWNELMYERVDDDMISDFDITDKLIRWGKNFNSSLILKHKKISA